MDVKENYSVIVENNFRNEKLNISILCSIARTGLEMSTVLFKLSFLYSVPVYRISAGIIIGVILLIIVVITLIILILYQK
jgi:hypothetical protein